MASIDYGMALARGYIADTPTYKADILKKVGGANVFKQESWWNEQLNKAIKEGFKEKTTERVSPGVFSGRGTFDSRVRRKGYESAIPVYEERYIKRSRGSGPQYLPIDTPNVDTRRYRVQKNIIGYDATKTKDVTQNVLNQISKQSKRQTERIKSEGAKERASKKRLTRGTGGLLAKAPIPGTEGMASGLPVLGEGGLGIGSTMLGQRQKL